MLEIRTGNISMLKAKLTFLTVSTLMHGVVLSSITPKPSCDYSPEGRKSRVVLAGLWALTQQRPVGLASWRNIKQH